MKIISEPGHFFTASAYTLTTHVIAKRVVCRDDEGNTDLEIGSAPGGNDEPSYMYYVNDGVYGSFNCLLYDHADVEASIPCKSKESDQREKNKWKFVIAINNFIFKILCRVYILRIVQ